MLNFFSLYNLPGRLVDPKLFRNSFETISSLVNINFSSEFLKKSLLTGAWQTLGDLCGALSSGDEASMFIGGPGPQKAQSHRPTGDTSVVGVEI